MYNKVVVKFIYILNKLLNIVLIPEVISFVAFIVFIFFLTGHLTAFKLGF